MTEPSTFRRLSRWMDLDWHIQNGKWLNVAKFAEEWDVTERTIHNDLELFAQLGYAAEYKGRLWQYSFGVHGPMFNENKKLVTRRHDPKRLKKKPLTP